MQIEVNPGEGVHVSEALEQHVHAKLATVARKHGDDITRLEVHFKDVNAGKGGPDTTCTMEAHPRGMPPVAVEALAEDAYGAAHAAAGKLERALDHRIGRREAR